MTRFFGAAALVSCCLGSLPAQTPDDETKAILTAAVPVINAEIGRFWGETALGPRMLASRTAPLYSPDGVTWRMDSTLAARPAALNGHLGPLLRASVGTEADRIDCPPGGGGPCRGTLAIEIALSHAWRIPGDSAVVIVVPRRRPGPESPQVPSVHPFAVFLAKTNGEWQAVQKAQVMLQSFGQRVAINPK